nr:MAG TPA_asm: hypothetical protein [Caudoviricetes sp.]
MRLRRFHRGSAVLIIAIIAAVLSGFVGFATTKAVHNSFGMASKSSWKLQAQNYAVSEAEYMRAVKYHDLDSVTVNVKQKIADTDFYKLFSISNEEQYTSTVVRRIVSIAVYHGADSDVPLYTIKVNRYYNGSGTTTDTTI